MQKNTVSEVNLCHFVLWTPQETPDTLAYLVEHYKNLVDEFVPDTLVQFGFYPVEIIPGIEYFAQFMKDSYDEEFTYKSLAQKDQAKKLFEQLLTQWYRSRWEQQLMTSIFINQYSQVSYQQVVDAQQDLEDYMRDHGGIGYTLDDGDNKDKLEIYK